MSTFGEMVTYVSKRLIDPSNTAVSAEDIEQSINESIDYWKKRRFWFNEVNDTDVLTQHDPDIPVTDTFLVPAFEDDGFCIEYGGTRYPLVKVTQQAYDARYLSNGYGLPEIYTRSGDGTYQCYPIPDQAYVFRKHYLKDYEALDGDDDTNDFTNHASRLINLWTTANLITELRQDVEAGNYYREATQNEYRQIRVLNDKMNGTGKLTIYSQLNDGGFR